MKNKFYLILLPIFLILSACEDAHQYQKKTSIEKVEIEEKTTVNKALPLSNMRTTIPEKIIQKEYRYEFKNLKGQLSTLDIKNDIYDFKNIKQSIVIVNIMSTWCPPCRGQIPHLSKLQQKFKENIFVMSILVHDDISKEKLDKFIIAQKILFYVSVSQSENLKFINTLAPKLGLAKDFPMPLTIVFVRGKYFTHYEGMIPEEMIESDIEQLLKKIKK
jgi:thiol-disulfide isomerase/thioredoxin